MSSGFIFKKRKGTKRGYEKKAYVPGTKKVMMMAPRAFPRLVPQAVEKKFVQNLLTTNMTADPTFTIMGGVYLNGGARLMAGVAFNERIGRHIILKHLEFRLEVRAPINTAAFHGTATRVVVIYDRECIGGDTVPAVTDVFRADDIVSMRAPDSYDRFQIISDETFNQPPPGVSGTTVIAPYYYHKFVKIPHPATYIKDGGALTSGGVMIWVGTAGHSITGTPTYTLDSVLRFQDPQP